MFLDVFQVQVNPADVDDSETVQDNKEQEENMVEPPASVSNNTVAAPALENGNTQDQIIDKVMITVEDDRVAEKNEKNVEDKRSEETEKSSEPRMIEEANPVIKKDKMELKYKYREGED